MDDTVLARPPELANNGVLVALVVIGKYTGGLLGEPQIEMRGFVYRGRGRDGAPSSGSEAITQVVGKGGTRAELWPVWSKTGPRGPHRDWPPARDHTGAHAHNVAGVA